VVDIGGSFSIPDSGQRRRHPVPWDRSACVASSARRLGGNDDVQRPGSADPPGDAGGGLKDALELLHGR